MLRRLRRIVVTLVGYRFRWTNEVRVMPPALCETCRKASVVLVETSVTLRGQRTDMARPDRVVRDPDKTRELWLCGRCLTGVRRRSGGAV